MRDYGIYWKNKKEEVERVELPFQKIETINLPRSIIGTMDQFGKDSENDEWKNKLIWGDNKYVMASLLPKFRGKINMIYADPPFFTGTNMNITLEVGDERAVKEPSAIEEIAYRNMWKEGPSSFFQYMYDRFVLMKDLLSDEGSIWVRFDYHYSHYIKGILDEIFGSENFRNEIIINRTLAKQPAKNNFTQQTESLFFYGKTGNNFFEQVRAKIEPQWYPLLDFPRVDKSPRIIKNVTFYPPVNRRWALSQDTINHYERASKTRINPNKEYIDCRGKTIRGYPELLYDEKIIRNDWLDIKGYGQLTGYPTENSEDLLKRVINASSKKGDLIADFFGGSGTTAIVAEKLGRKWITGDIGRFSIHTIRKRLLDIPLCEPFEIINLGKYERKHWIGQTLGSVYRDYIDFILQLYKAKPIYDYKTIHGMISGRAVHVGPIDYPVTKAEVEECLKEAKENGFESLDILGWDFEMEFNDRILRELRESYELKISLRIIPNEVMDKRAVEAGDVDFYEHAFLEAKIVEIADSKRTVEVSLENFIIPNPESIPEELRDKILKWSDFIDYWSVDWNYRDDTFHNEWQEFRTKKKKNLQLESIKHHYDEPGNYKIMIKVIDIFGNDTTIIKEVTVV